MSKTASRSAAGRDTCMLHLQTRGWVDVVFTVVARRRDKTFSFCAVWWKKTIRWTSHTIRYSKSMMLSIYAHSSKIWASFNAFLRWSSGSLQRASLVTENQKPFHRHSRWLYIQQQSSRVFGSKRRVSIKRLLEDEELCCWTKSHYASCWNRRTWTLLRVMRSCFDKTKICVWFGI